jgi:hypothetical protein
MADLDRTDSAVVRFLQLDRAVTDVFAYMQRGEEKADSEYVSCLPSISFQAFKKSSGSENATKPYLAFKGDINIPHGSEGDIAHLLTQSVTNHTCLREGCVLVESIC